MGSNLALSELVCVDPARIDEVWPHVAPLLRAATEKCGDWSLHDVGVALDNGALLWITFDGQIRAAAVTRLIRNNDGLICQAIACGGQDDDWPDTFSEIEDYARAEGCVKCRISGRPGWARVFKEYKVELVTLEKDLA